LALPKTHVYREGGRPVIYEQREIAKKLLPPNEHWRIVNFDLSKEDDFIDWTHEREWRVPGNLGFSLDQATVILSCQKAYSLFVKGCAKPENSNILKKIRGLVCLGSVYF